MALLVLLALAAGLVALGRMGLGPVVVTREDEQKLLLMLGSPREEATAPGLAARIPLVEDVRTFERRWMHLSSDPEEIQTQDRERIVVDNYVVWRIADPLLFYESFPTGMTEAEAQIDREVRANVRAVIGQRTFADVLRDARSEIMEEITRRSDESMRRAGIEVNDVRISRTELPPSTLKNVYARMRAERERQARKYRAEGEEEARRIRAQADREARVVVAEAREQAQMERGRGEAEAVRITAEAFSLDPDFYAFQRTLEAYRKTLAGGKTTVVLPPDHAFFRLFGTGRIEAGSVGPAPGVSPGAAGSAGSAAGSTGSAAGSTGSADSTGSAAGP